MTVTIGRREARRHGEFAGIGLGIGDDGERQLLRTWLRQGAGRYSQEWLVSGRLARERRLLHPLGANSATAPRLGLAGADFLRLRCPIIDQRSTGASQSRSCAK